MSEKWKNIIITGTVGVIGLAPVMDYIQLQDDKDAPNYYSYHPYSEKENDLKRALFLPIQVSSGTASTNVVLNI